ncbi:unnamed protein product [Sphagnum balticum]
MAGTSGGGSGSGGGDNNEERLKKMSPSSPDRPIYNNTPTQLPFVGSWDGSNYVVPVSTWVSNCPQASSQVLAGGGTNLRQLMHADHYSYPKPKTFESHTSSSSCSSLQLEVMDMIAVGPALNTNGKPRARRGSATDPQSIYARHRRNKINERLKTLQHLVPNGAKVDIVTMLEEAIDYVKYLQNQVKLLKMEQWMSGTPTIYNGVDISAI